MSRKRYILMRGACVCVVLVGLAMPALLTAMGEAPGKSGSVGPGEPDAVVDPNDPMNNLEAEIKSVTGKSVQYSIDGSDNWQAAQVGVKLSKEAVVRTGFASSCEMSFRGHTVIKVEALSSVRIADYLGHEDAEVVRADLQYGAVRCGVEKGRVKSDTKISTPVAVLAIRGTITKVEYDRGTGQCNLGVLTGGLADVFSRKGRYVLSPGMKTDADLSRHLQSAIFGRSVFVTGNRAIGAVTDTEATKLSEIFGAVNLFDGQGLGSSSQEERSFLIGDGGSDDGDDGCNPCPDGECDPGPSE